MAVGGVELAGNDAEVLLSDLAKEYGCDVEDGKVEFTPLTLPGIAFFGRSYRFASGGRFGVSKLSRIGGYNGNGANLFISIGDGANPYLHLARITITERFSPIANGIGEIDLTTLNGTGSTYTYASGSVTDLYALVPNLSIGG